MQNKSQKKLKLIYSKNTLDIVQFGSSISSESEANDIDIAVLFEKISLKEQLEEAQKIKKQLESHFSKPIHIKSYDLFSLFDKGNFAKESILFYGKSLITGEYFASKFGLIPRINILYSLNKLQKKDKVRFNYMLNGKKGSYGLLREYNGYLVKPGIIEILPEHEKHFIDSIKAMIEDFKVKKVFLTE